MKRPVSHSERVAEHPERETRLRKRHLQKKRPHVVGNMDLQPIFGCTLSHNLIMIPGLVLPKLALDEPAGAALSGTGALACPLGRLSSHAEAEGESQERRTPAWFGKENRHIGLFGLTTSMELRILTSSHLSTLP